MSGVKNHPELLLSLQEPFASPFATLSRLPDKATIPQTATSLSAPASSINRRTTSKMPFEATLEQFSLAGSLSAQLRATDAQLPSGLSKPQTQSR